MLETNGSVRLEDNVAEERVSFKGLLQGFREAWERDRAVARRQMLEEAQEEHLSAVFRGEAEIVCKNPGCGRVHRGPERLYRRGWRSRRVMSAEGAMEFRLRQVTCRACGRTWSPYPEVLGLKARQRVLEEVEQKLLEVLVRLSYAQTCDLAESWLGVEVSPRTLHARVQEKAEALELTPEPEAGTVIADGTKIPAGEKAQGTEIRAGFQIVEKGQEQGRPCNRLRLVGVGIGNGSWSQALPRTLSPRRIVSDADPSLRLYVRESFPEARHQLCEWHVLYSLEWSLINDRIAWQERRVWKDELNQILFDRRTQARKRERYDEFVERIGRVSPKAKKQLEAASGQILYEEPSPERTNSLAERQMREINRRMENGSRWSERGARNLVLLRLAQRHNPDDYARLWSPN
jgi:hypothetical protein